MLKVLSNFLYLPMNITSLYMQFLILYLNIHFPNLALLTYIEIFIYKLFLAQPFNMEVLIIGLLPKEVKSRHSATRPSPMVMEWVWSRRGGFAFFWLFYSMLNIFCILSQILVMHKNYDA